MADEKDLTTERQDPQGKLMERISNVTNALRGIRPDGVTQEEWKLSMSYLWNFQRESFVVNSLKGIGDLDEAPHELQSAFLSLVDEVGAVACDKGKYSVTKRYEPEEGGVDLSDPKTLLEFRLSGNEETFPYEGSDLPGALITLDFLRHPAYVPNEYEKGIVAEFIGGRINADALIMAYSGQGKVETASDLHIRRMKNCAKAGLQILTRK